MLVAWVPTPRGLICGRLLYRMASTGHVAAALKIEEPHSPYGVPNIWNVCTAADYRRRGYSRALVADAMAEWRTTHKYQGPFILQVELDNTAARALYETLGFVPDTSTLSRTEMEANRTNGFFQMICVRLAL